MPDTREKLFDLMMRDPCPYPVVCSARCEYYKSQHCHAERYADHLIANGVTIHKQGRWIWRKGEHGEPECICSACGKHSPYAEDGRVDMAPFCHHCGSRNGGGEHG